MYYLAAPLSCSSGNLFYLLVALVALMYPLSRKDISLPSKEVLSPAGIELQPAYSFVVSGHVSYLLCYSRRYPCAYPVLVVTGRRQRVIPCMESPKPSMPLILMLWFPADARANYYRVSLCQSPVERQYLRWTAPTQALVHQRKQDRTSSLETML
jgi:hypothetical protein